MVATAVDSTDIQAARREFLDGFNAEAKALSDGKVSWAYSLRYRLIWGCSRCGGSTHHQEWWQCLGLWECRRRWNECSELAEPRIDRC